MRVRFQWLRELLIEYGVEVKYDEIDRAGNHPDWMGWLCERLTVAEDTLVCRGQTV